MGSIKELLGEVDAEEFEAMRKMVYSELKDADLDKFMIVCMDEENFVYDCWVTINGKDLVNKWVEDHGGYVTWKDIDELIIYAHKEFIKWLEN